VLQVKLLVTIEFAPAVGAAKVASMSIPPPPPLVKVNVPVEGAPLRVSGEMEDAAGATPEGI
jgi:hypothetical protein